MLAAESEASSCRKCLSQQHKLASSNLLTPAAHEQRYNQKQRMAASKRVGMSGSNHDNSPRMAGQASTCTSLQACQCIAATAVYPLAHALSHPTLLLVALLPVGSSKSNSSLLRLILSACQQQHKLACPGKSSGRHQTPMKLHLHTEALMASDQLLCQGEKQNTKPKMRN